MNKLYCIDCAKDVEPIIKEGPPNWFDSYFCPDCKGMEIARKSNKEGDTGFAIWNGYEFVRRNYNEINRLLLLDSDRLPENLEELQMGKYDCKACGHYWSSGCKTCNPPIDEDLIKRLAKDIKPYWTKIIWFTGEEKDEMP